MTITKKTVWKGAGLVVALLFSFLLGTNYMASQFYGGLYDNRTEMPLNAVVDRDMLELVNSERAKNGLKALNRDTTLDTSAKVRAQEIAETNVFEHTRPNGTAFSTAIYSVGNFPSVGENLAKCGHSNQDTMERWIASPTHHENMLGRLQTGGDWTIVGYATIWDDDLGCSVDVMHFAR